MQEEQKNNEIDAQALFQKSYEDVQGNLHAENDHKYYTARPLVTEIIEVRRHVVRTVGVFMVRVP